MQPPLSQELISHTTFEVRLLDICLLRDNIGFMLTETIVPSRMDDKLPSPKRQRLNDSSDLPQTSSSLDTVSFKSVSKVVTFTCK